MPPQERIQVAIVGAGIAGLTLAVALNAFDSGQKIAIDLYESTSQLSEIGAGIIMWPGVWEIFKELGLGDTLTPFFDHYPDHKPRVVFEVRKADQKNGFRIVEIMKDGGVLRIHRADLQRSLLRHLPLTGSDRPINSTCALHLSHKLINYEFSPSDFSSGSLKLYFENKANKRCDILIGADGIRSTVRQLFLTRMPDREKNKAFLDPIWTGSLVYRGLVDAEELRKVYPGHRALNHPGIMYVGKEKHCVVYAVSGGKYINVVGAVHNEKKRGAILSGQWNQEVTQNEFLECFVGWDEEFQALIHCIPHPTRWALQALNHLDIFASDRVFLLGDSAHAMAPHLGAGAAVGIEDAYILASLLAHPSHRSSMQHITCIAEIYNSIRVPKAIGWAKNSMRQGLLYGLCGPGFEHFVEGSDIPKEMLVKLFESVRKIWSQNTSDADVDRKRAIRRLLGVRL